MQASLNFEIQEQAPGQEARLGKLNVNGKTMPTPNVVQTGSAITALTARELAATGTQAIKEPVLSWWLKYGGQVGKLGDLHKLMNWPGIIVTAPGTDKVYQWAKPRGRKKGGVSFHDPLTGQMKFYTPQLASQVQQRLGGDITLAFSRAAAYFAPVDDLNAAVAQTAGWLSQNLSPNMLAPVVGGGLKRARQASADAAKAAAPAGYFIAGIEPAVPENEQGRILAEVAGMLPAAGVRYLPTSGSLHQLVTAVASGIDLVDSDLASREASLGNAITGGRLLHLDREHFAFSTQVLLDQCGCPVCQAGVTRAYIHYLLDQHAPLGTRFLLLHNLFTVNHLLSGMRQAIADHRFAEYCKQLEK